MTLWAHALGGVQVAPLHRIAQIVCKTGRRKAHVALHIHLFVLFSFRTCSGWLGFVILLDTCGCDKNTNSNMPAEHDTSTRLIQKGENLGNNYCKLIIF